MYTFDQHFLMSINQEELNFLNNYLQTIHKNLQTKNIYAYIQILLYLIKYIIFIEVDKSRTGYFLWNTVKHIWFLTFNLDVEVSGK